MREAIGDIWTLHSEAICIPTNGQINGNGKATMGKGLAAQAAVRYPDLPYHLATRIQKYGNQVYLFREGKVGINEKMIFTVPTKEHWGNASDVALIAKSCMQLRHLQQALNLREILLPMLGCGLGNLKEEQVLPILTLFLDDSFTLVRLA